MAQKSKNEHLALKANLCTRVNHFRLSCWKIKQKVKFVIQPISQMIEKCTCGITPFPLYTDFPAFTNVAFYDIIRLETFINDVTQEGVCVIFDTMYEVVSKAAISVWQRGEWSILYHICVTYFMNVLLSHGKKLADIHIFVLSKSAKLSMYFLFKM